MHTTYSMHHGSTPHSFISLRALRQPTGKRLIHIPPSAPCVWYLISLSLSRPSRSCADSSMSQPRASRTCDMRRLRDSASRTTKIITRRLRLSVVTNIPARTRLECLPRHCHTRTDCGCRCIALFPSMGTAIHRPFGHGKRTLSPVTFPLASSKGDWL